MLISLEINLCDRVWDRGRCKWSISAPNPSWDFKLFTGEVWTVFFFLTQPMIRRNFSFWLQISVGFSFKEPSLRGWHNCSLTQRPPCTLPTLAFASVWSGKPLTFFFFSDPNPKFSWLAPQPASRVLAYVKNLESLGTQLLGFMFSL